ncbi:MAG: mechanosensitive ion channel, partial [Planctomycetales bacterium]
LTEQPIRVGDTVTVDSVTGIVSKIRMRATVVTDWDRKEFIIPNKDFISGRVLNWSLTNTINRVVIMVRISRDADIAQICEMLLKVAQDHPAILEDPPPLATIEEFGESAIHYALRCYLPSMEGRLGVKHQLHAEIHRLFAKAGIDLAYPQRDIHVHPENGGETAHN